MAEREEFGFQKPQLTEDELNCTLNRVDELVNTLIDDELNEDQLGELESMLIKSPEARSQYVGILQLHSDLIDFYRPKDNALESNIISQVIASPGLPPGAGESA